MPGPTGLGFGSLLSQSTSSKGLVPTTIMVSPVQTSAGTLDFRGDGPLTMGGWVCVDDGWASMNFSGALLA